MRALGAVLEKSHACGFNLMDRVDGRVLTTFVQTLRNLLQEGDETQRITGLSVIILSNHIDLYFAISSRSGDSVSLRLHLLELAGVAIRRSLS